MEPDILLDYKIDINKYLRTLPKETIYYQPKPGNAGDSLIEAATFQLFSQNNVKLGLTHFTHFLGGVEHPQMRNGLISASEDALLHQLRKS